MRSSDFRTVVEPYTDTTRMQVIKRGAVQSNQIMADFKGRKPTTKAKQAPPSCGCGDINRK